MYMVRPGASSTAGPVPGDMNSGEFSFGFLSKMYSTGGDNNIEYRTGKQDRFISEIGQYDKKHYNAIVV
jgi:hypothetical protein